MSGISWSGVVLRVVLAIALVLLTFNPSGYSFTTGSARRPRA